MNAIDHAAGSPAGRLREARRQLLHDGTVASGVLDAGLLDSWRRSHAHGLAPDSRTPGVPHASRAQLSRAVERQHSFVAHARPVMEFVGEQIRGCDSIIILADAQGMLLDALGDGGFVDKAARVALRPGANWDERWRGTNAIGTALATGAAVAVYGAEHYLERNAFLNCAAAPVVDPSGQPLGVIDISGDRRGFPRHALGLSRSAARLVEHQLFQARFGNALTLHLHRHPEGLGTVTEGLLALSEDGWIIGANSVALAWLGLSVSAIGATTIERALSVTLSSLLGQGERGRPLPQLVERDDGSTLWVRVDAGRSTAVAAPRASAARTAAAKAPADGLAALDTGDGAMQAAICRARRVLDKPIALLLQGESGVGKELFARACHASGPRRGRPFVAVNCAALPENLIEAELFGYCPGAFTGASRDGARGRIREADSGTLFLDEIGDMPLALQARLLRVLQERQVSPLGGGKPVAVDFQLICATHRRLRAEVDGGRFREDLFYRINGLALQLPPLREREDMAALVAAMLRELAPGRETQLAPDVASAFASHRWPGNLRQLANVLRTACALMGDDESMIDWEHLPDDVAEELRRHPSPRAVEHNDTDLRVQANRCVTLAVRESRGNMSEAARRLGISRNTLYRKLRESGLQSSAVAADCDA
ncbi:MAG TPA: sigma-54-dependent Fis family transcriptional regulator [Burkholderiaceae bacterium]|nr:sigma-54-dependent Fis family transcriptional regulator [Burkholderiaceae bacterium]